MKEFENIKELFTERKWTRDGTVFNHRQVLNNGKVYVYEVDHNEDFKHPWYEVFKRKVIPSIENNNGKLVKSKTDGHIKYPSNEDFGKWAKNCVNQEQVNHWVEQWSKE